VLALGARLVNANKAVYVAVLVWWIVWLWLDEPGTKTEAVNAAPERVYLESPASATDGNSTDTVGTAENLEEARESQSG